MKSLYNNCVIQQVIDAFERLEAIRHLPRSRVRGDPSFAALEAIRHLPRSRVRGEPSSRWKELEMIS